MKRADKWRPHKCEWIAVNNDEEGAFDDQEPSIGTCDPVGLQQEINQTEQLVAAEQDSGDDANSAAALPAIERPSWDHRLLAVDSEDEAEDEVDDDEVVQPQPAKRARTDGRRREADAAAISNVGLQQLIARLAEDDKAAAARRAKDQEAEQALAAERQHSRQLFGQIHGMLHERELRELEHQARMEEELRRQQGLESAHAASIRGLEERHAEKMEHLKQRGQAAQERQV